MSLQQQASCQSRAKRAEIKTSMINTPLPCALLQELALCKLRSLPAAHKASSTLASSDSPAITCVCCSLNCFTLLHTAALLLCHDEKLRELKPCMSGRDQTQLQSKQVFCQKSHNLCLQGCNRNAHAAVSLQAHLQGQQNCKLQSKATLKPADQQDLPAGM